MMRKILDPSQQPDNITKCEAVTAVKIVKGELLHIMDDDGKCWCEPEIMDGVIVHRRTDN